MNVLKKILERRPLIVGWIWILLCIPAFLFWQESVPFLVAMSIYANIESSFATNAAKKETREMRASFDELKRLLEAMSERPPDPQTASPRDLQC